MLQRVSQFALKIAVKRDQFSCFAKTYQPIVSPPKGITDVCKRICRNSYYFTGAKRSSGKVFAAVTLFQLLEYIGSKEHESKLSETMNEVKQLLEEGDVQNATEKLKIALKLAQNLNSDDDIFNIKEQLALIAVETKQSDEAEKLLLEVIQFLDKKKFKEDNLKVIYLKLKLAEVYRNQGNYDKAENILNMYYKHLEPKIQDAIKDKEQEMVLLWVKLLIEKAYYHLATKKIDDAFRDFKEAYDICVVFRGEISEQSVLLLKNLGIVCYQKGDLQSALEYLKKAVHHGKHLPGMVELSLVYTSLGNIYLKQGLLRDAEINCIEGYKNATRHQYGDGIKEANICLQEIKDAES